MEPWQASVVSVFLALVPAAIVAYCLRSRWFFLFAVAGSFAGQALSPFVMAEFGPDATALDRIISHAAIDLPYTITAALAFGPIGCWIDPNLRKRWPFKKRRQASSE
jgi:hypothetical protein